MASFPIMSNIAHCRIHRQNVERNYRNDSIVPKETDAPPGLTHPAQQCSPNTPTSIGAPFVCNPIYDRYAKENIFANIRSILGQRH